jgi:predicted membrane protein
VIRELLVTKLRFSYLTLQMFIGALLPLLILPIPAFTRFASTGFRRACTGVAAVLVLVQVAAMRWNVVVGGQLFSKSFRGFVDYPVTWFGREGLLAAATVLAMPMLLLWVAMKLLPVWPPSQDTESGAKA